MEVNKLTPTLENILNEVTLKWVIICGEGGVGKTTCSCSLAVLLSEVRDKVLIISLHPSNDISEAFDQRFTSSPNLVNGFENLYAMEIGPNEYSADNDPVIQDEFLKCFPKFESNEIEELLEALPGYLETQSFAKILRLFLTDSFSVIVFVAGTIDRTMKFLSFPKLIENGLLKLLNVKPNLSTYVPHISNLLGLHDLSFTDNILPAIKGMNKEFHDSKAATVVCICNAEKGSVNEVICLSADLKDLKIDSHNIVINRVLFPKTVEKPCSACLSHIESQDSSIYLLPELFKEYHIVKLPLLGTKIRGTIKIRKFSEYLIKSYAPK